MKALLTSALILAALVSPAAADENRMLVTKSIGMLRLAVTSCDFGLTQDAIDPFQAGVEAAYGDQVDRDIFNAQQAEIPSMQSWDAAQRTAFCGATKTLAQQLKLL